MSAETNAESLQKENEQLRARIAELEARINILLEQRNRLGQDVQNAAITGVVPENHAIGAQLGLVANMRAKLADLARKAAHDVTLTNEGNITDRQLADAVNELRDIAIKYHAAGQLRERIAGVVLGLVRGEPATVAVNAVALEALRAAVADSEHAASPMIVGAARRLLAGGE